MPPIFSSTFRAWAMALSSSRLHARPLRLLEQLLDLMKSGLGGRLRDGFFGGTMPVCAAAARLAEAPASAGPVDHIVKTAIAVSTARDGRERTVRLRAAFAEPAVFIPTHRRQAR